MDADNFDTERVDEMEDSFPGQVDEPGDHELEVQAMLDLKEQLEEQQEDRSEVILGDRFVADIEEILFESEMIIYSEEKPAEEGDVLNVHDEAIPLQLLKREFFIDNKDHPGTLDGIYDQWFAPKVLAMAAELITLGEVVTTPMKVDSDDVTRGLLHHVARGEQISVLLSQKYSNADLGTNITISILAGKI